MSNKSYFFMYALNLFCYVQNLLASPVNPQNGGQDTYKYHVSIQRIYRPGNPNSGLHLCSGAIIRDSYVLTTSCCFMVRVNGNMISNIPPISSRLVVVAGTSPMHGLGFTRPIEKVLIPDEYNQSEGVLVGNIAVVKLFDNLNVANHRDRLHILPLVPVHSSHFYENKKALVPANGCQTVFRNVLAVLHLQPNPVTEIPQFLEVHMLEKSDCPYFDNSICAIIPDRPQIRICADSGSPLVYGDTLIGVLSHQENDINGIVFTRVSVFTKFINNAMKGVYTNMQVLDR